MNQKVRLILYIAVGAIVAWSIASNVSNYLPKVKTQAIENRKKVELITCPTSINIPNGEKVECGYLIVPENRERSDSRKIKVFFARVAAYTHSGSENQPIVYLAGGPGEAGSEYLVLRMEQFFALRRDRDLIVIDQRGTGFSQPRLDCNLEVATSQLSSTLKKCLADYQRQGIDLTGYNTTQSARDLQDLRRALNIDRWNLIGTSYGTRLAQETMRIDPQGIRSVVLNSTSPTFNSFFSPRLAADQKRIFEQMLNDCAADSKCASAFPHLREVFLSIQRQMSGKVLKLTLKSSEKKTVSINFDEFVALVERQLSSTKTIPQVPLLIWSMAESIQGKANNNTLANYLESDSQSLLDHKNQPKADGLHFSVICHEDWSSIKDLSKLERQMAAYEPFFSSERLELYKTACPMWNVGRVAPAFEEKVVSDIPTLLLIGNYDLKTAPEWSDEVAAGLTNSQVISFRGTGHDVIDNSLCGRALTTDFIAKPNTPLPLDCVQRMKPPEFLTELVSESNK